MKKKNRDLENLELEMQQAEELLKKCFCGHDRMSHLDWGHEGACEKVDCSCRKFGNKCNACGTEGFHNPEVCISLLRGKVQILLNALKATLHLSLEMKGTKNLSQSELAAIQTAKDAIRDTEGL
jgi:hypothetical protein